MTENALHLHGLPQNLVDSGLLDHQTAKDAIDTANQEKQPFITHILEHQLTNAHDIAMVASEAFGIPLLDITTFDKTLIPTNLVSENLIRKHNALPLFKVGVRLYVALSDPTNQRALDEFKFHTRLNTHCLVVEDDKLHELIEEIINASDEEIDMGDISDSDLEDLEISSESDADLDSQDADGTDEAPIVRFINKMLIDAIHKGASDIHFEPYENTYRVRFRTDGILYEVAKPPVKLANRLAARLKVLSKLDISERRVPQDGRFKMKISNKRSIDIRLSTCPTLYGEKIVMRLLDPGNASIGIDSLGFSPSQKEAFVGAVKKPYGMVLVTGPTGSGKTITLYTAINLLNDSEKNISTVEDPVEINVPGINQVHVNLKAGLDFSSALRAFLRQDPDIIMVGEIRDLETAEIGIKAAQTGHLVLSTLHTNSAPETLTRLVNMGVAAFNIASTVSLVIAQRLARKLCNECKIPTEIPDEALVDAGFSQDIIKTKPTLYGPKGCKLCAAGYKGRIGIFEVLPISDAIGRCIMSGGNAIELLDIALTEGLVTLRQSGIEKVAAGLTSLEEINRITRD